MLCLLCCGQRLKHQYKDRMARTTFHATLGVRMHIDYSYTKQ